MDLNGFSECSTGGGFVALSKPCEGGTIFITAQADESKLPAAPGEKVDVGLFTTDGQQVGWISTDLKTAVRLEYHVAPNVVCR